MLNVETSPKVIYDVKDASWKPNEKGICNIIVSENHFIELVFDKGLQRFVSLFAVETSQNDAQNQDLIRERFSGLNPIIPRRNIFLSIPKTMLIPDALYDKENLKNFLENQHRIEDKDAIDDFPVKIIEARMAFLYPDSMNVSIPGLNWIPLDAPWLDTLSLAHKNNNEVHFHFNISDGFISVAVFKEGGLQFYNTFETTTPEEVLYFVMFITEQLHINPHTDSYYYSGFISKTDETYNLLSKYIKLLKPEERPAAYNYSMPVLDIPASLFFNAFCTPICES